MWIWTSLPTNGGIENLCFIAVLQPKQKLRLLVHVMSKWLFTIDLYYWNSPFFVMNQDSKGSIHKFIPLYIHGIQDDTNFKPIQHCIISYNHFSSTCSLFPYTCYTNQSFCLCGYKLKVLAVQSWNFARTFIWLCKVWICNKMKFEKCVVLGFYRSSQNFIHSYLNTQ